MFLTVSIWIVASALDHLDSKIALCCDQSSEFGVLLDIISDNIFRASTWMACIVVSYSPNLKDESSNTSWVLPMITVGLISIEWMTIVSTQMAALLMEKNANESISLEDPEGGQDKVPADPWIIEQMYKNDFRNALGLITIFGSMECGVVHFLHLLRVPILREFPCYASLLDASRILAYAGRLLALYAECWFCFDYLRMVIKGDTPVDDADKDDK